MKSSVITIFMLSQSWSPLKATDHLSEKNTHTMKQSLPAEETWNRLHKVPLEGVWKWKISSNLF